MCPCLDVKHEAAHRLVINRKRSRRFHQRKKVDQYRVITLAIDGNDISFLISKKNKDRRCRHTTIRTKRSLFGDAITFPEPHDDLMHTNSENFICFDMRK